MEQRSDLYDVAIVGYGAAAMSAGIYAARYQMKTIILGDQFGGETALASVIENYPGAPMVEGLELMLRMKEQVDHLGVEIVEEAVTEAGNENGCFRVRAGDRDYRASTVILAAGRERRRLGLPREDELRGRGVSYCATCDAPLYKGRVTALVGGGDASIKGALLLARHAQKVYVIYRGDKFTRPEPIALKQMEETPNIEALLRTNVVKLNGKEFLESISIDRPYRGRKELEAEGLFVEIGAEPRNELAKMLGVALNEKGEIQVDKLMYTNVDGVLAAGDVTDGAGDLKQTITAACQGVLAATSAYKHITTHPHLCELHAIAYNL